MSICLLTEVFATVNIWKVRDNLNLSVLSGRMAHAISKNIKFVQIRPSYQKLQADEV